MADHLEVGVADPVTDSRLGASEEIVEYSDLVAQNHETVNKMGADEASASGDKDTLSLGCRQQLDRREARQRRVRDRTSVGVEDGLGQVVRTLVLFVQVFQRRRGRAGFDVVRPEVERTKHIERHFRVETKTIETNRCNLLATLVKGVDL